MELIDKIKAGSEARMTIDWPGADDTQVEIRVCTEADHLNASLEADKIFAGTKIEAQNVDAYSAERETQLLFRCILDPETHEQLFKKMADFRRVLIPEVKDTIATKIDELHGEYSPDLDTISESDFDKLVEDVKKNAAAAIEPLSDINTLKRLALFMASR